MDSALRDLVVRRAGNRCEYCLIPQSAMPYVPLHLEHIIARQHRGTTTKENLCLACSRCNAYKGPNLSSIDPQSGETVSLFHPRREVWSDHFLFSGDEIIGITSIGRATAELLNMNHPDRVDLRQEWRESGGKFE